MTVTILSDESQIAERLRNTQVLLLDFDGTLVDYRENEARALTTVLSEVFGDDPNIKEMVLKYRDINDLLWKRYERKEIGVDEIQVERFKQLADIYDIKVSPENLNESYLEQFGIQVVPYDDIVESIRSFRQEFPEIKVIILTNGTHPTQIIRSAKAGLDKVTDGLVSSDLVGFAKPNPHMFEYTSKEFGIDLKDSVMVGDSLTSDIAGAKNLDITSCLITSGTYGHYQNYEQLEPRPDIVAENCVAFLQYISDIKSS